MKIRLALFLGLCTLTAGLSQTIVELPHKNSENVVWEGGEREYYSNIWNTEIVSNVSIPTMEVFVADPEQANGTSVIIAPGGGLYAHSIKKEGTDVAKWLNAKGITAFVLKYRLVPTQGDAVQEITEAGARNPAEIGEKVTPILPLAIQDGLSALSYVRTHADTYGIQPDKIGFMGFSAGGAVTIGVAYNSSLENRPDFIVPVYPWTDIIPIKDAPDNAPPMLVVCATDDPLGLAKGSIALYTAWLQEGKKVGLHMYAKGGHGFGMQPQGLPSDTWITRFYEWGLSEGFIALAPPKEE
ncbi:alpha/beta hydrolase [Flavobacteriaceae bacterium 3-367]|uniref:alpha/beta hydrolase n=1 Tax=Eudoraea algarum TaxID=3417568 RepID=UPI00326A7896